MIEYKTGESTKRNVWAAMWNGMRGRCPKCQEGKMFPKYLKVADACDHCAQELHHHQADDAPAYFSIFLIGHILVPMVLFIEVNYHWPLWVHASLWLPVALILSLLFLPIIKGTLVGLQWANEMHGFGDEQALGSNKPDDELHALHETNETARPIT